MAKYQRLVLLQTVALLCLNPDGSGAKGVDDAVVLTQAEDSFASLQSASDNETSKDDENNATQTDDADSSSSQGAEHVDTSHISDEAQHTPRLNIKQITRIPSISVKEFFDKYSPPNLAVPIILENAMTDSFKEEEWSKEAIVRDCGHIELINWNDTDCEEYTFESANDMAVDGVVDCHFVKYVDPERLVEEWAGLQVANLTELNITTVEDMINFQDTPAGKHLYLHDAPLKWYCPARLDSIRVPKYFHTDYRYLENDIHMTDKMKLGHFPDIFISNKGTGSPLHADAHMTRFYFQLLSGKKHWRLIPPSESWKAYPRYYDDDLYPTRYHVDLMNPDFNKFPKLDGTLVYEAVLKPGDLLFVPEMWGHQVLNLEDSMATSLNFVDYHTVPAHRKEMLQNIPTSPQDVYSNFIVSHNCRYEAERKFQAKEVSTKDIRIAMQNCIADGKDYASWGDGDESLHHYEYWFEVIDAFFMPLDPPEAKDENYETLEWLNGHLFNSRPVPQAAKDFVAHRSQFKNGIDSYRTKNGFPALHVAILANFESVVAYLLEHGASLLERDYSGWTAKQLAIRLGHTGIVKIIEQHERALGRKQMDEYIDLFYALF